MCNGLLGWLLGHKFEERYDYAPPVGIHPDFTKEDEVLLFVEHLVTKTYACDVCFRCGKIVKFYEEIQKETKFN